MLRPIFISRLLKSIIIIFLLFNAKNILAQGSVTFPTVNGTPGTQISAPVNVSGLPASTVYSFEFILSYDKNVVYITGIETAGTMLAGNPPTVNADTANGRISMAWATGTSPLTTSGILVNLKFKFRNVGTSTLTTIYNSSQSFYFNNWHPTVANGSATTSLIQQYTVTTSSNPPAGGTTSGGGTFNSGSSVLVTATPSSGYNFVNWTEGSTIVSTNAGYTFNISSNRTLVANFAQQFSVSTSSNPPAGGTTSGGGTFNSGSSVIVTATPNSGYSFVNWTESSTVVSTNASYSFNISSNRTLLANFVINTYTLTVIAANGTVTKNPDQANYNYGSTVQLTATPATGYIFTGWSGDATGSTNPLTVTMDGNKNITANFALNTFTVTLSANPSAGGIVSQSGTGTYNSGSGVTVTATPSSGYNFVNWTEGSNVVSTGTSYAFIINSNRNLVANFALAQYTVTISLNPPGGGATTGSGIYSAGQIVTVTATPNSGYQFVNWTEGSTAVSSGTNYAFTINASRVLVANFALLSVLSVTPDFVTVDYPAGTTSFSVANTGSGTLNWIAVSNSSWVSITGIGSGTNSGTINISYNANSGSARVGTITVTAAGATGSPKTVEIRQAMFTDVRDLNNNKPETFNLFQNYPNPFNPTTSIRFNLSKDSMVNLIVYNLLGQEVTQLINKEMPAGSYQYDFNASQLTSGLYIYKIQTEEFVQVKKMLLMK